MIRHLDLFSGIGGFALAANWAGYETIGFCEIDPYCQRVLRKHWPDVPVWGDVRSLTIERIVADTKGAGRHPSRSIGGQAGSVVALADRGEHVVDLITAGYPCQPFSLAGKRLGAADDRHLWPEVKRLLAELRPARFLGENVAGHINMGLDDVLSDLEEIGYTARPVVIPACAVNAPHRRDRVWIMAYADSDRCDDAGAGEGGAEGPARGATLTLGELWPDSVRRLGNDGIPAGERSEDVADTEGGVRFGAPSGGTGHVAFGGETAGYADESGSQGRGLDGERAGERTTWSAGAERSRTVGQKAQQCVGESHDGLSGRLVDPRWGGNPLNAFGPDWEADVPRVVATEKDRVHRLKALGNAIVPQVAYQVLQSMEAA